ncbi:MAG: FtsX-like permease family protein [Bacteroidales bacterium]|nr:FtsX-like permease family protein [Bacteroidales bacterium]
MIDFWQEIYGTIKRNKLRTFLTGFSVAWGIFILIVLLGAGNGLIHAFEKNSQSRALNSVRIFAGQTSKAFNGLAIGRRILFKNKDVELLKRHFEKNVMTAGATISHSDTVSYGTEGTSLSIVGVNPDYVNIESCKMKMGRFINEQDINEKRKVVVLCEKTVKTLFLHQINPIGFLVNVNGLMYQVIGVYTVDSENQSNDAYVPFTTSQLIYCKGDSIDDIIFTTKGLDTRPANSDFEDNYRVAMGKSHNFDPLDKSAIWIWNRLEQYLDQQQGNHILKVAIWVIGIFTLLSGIVGVSNIMLITVRERTREFGIRKALGAKPASILKLIIAESIAITALFGYIGMFAGVAATEYMNALFGNQTMNAGVFSTTVFSNPTVDISVAIQATITLIIAGTLAGFFPARKATKIRPIEALRAE